jgi:hypothetical protein
MTMKKVIPVLVLLMLVASVGLASAITWGEPDGDNHPNVGLIIFDDDEGPAWRCSGTLIAPDVVLTAGHCTEGAVAARVWFDEIVEGNPEYPFGGATSIEGTPISHPDYYWGPRSNPYDVGVVLLEEPAEGIIPAMLPTEGFLDDLDEQGMLKQGQNRASFTVVGYGLSLDWPPPVFGTERVRQFAASEFLNLRSAWLHMSQNHAPGRGHGGTCGGDSGGPTFWEDEVLVAVTSWGDAVCVATGTAYRIDIPSTLGFLAQYLD